MLGSERSESDHVDVLVPFFFLRQELVSCNDVLQLSDVVLNYRFGYMLWTNYQVLLELSCQVQVVAIIRVRLM